LGITRRIPRKTIRAVAISLFFRDSPKKKGSIKVTNKGKLEKVTSPTATEDIWMERKKTYQWKASNPPWRIKKKKDLLSKAVSFVLENIFAYTNKAMAAKKVLPKTIKSGLQDKNFPKSPANPNKNTARWILTIPLFNIALEACKYRISA
jgi:hypothetical protein